MNKGKTCGCPHHKVIPALVILFALDFLLANNGVVSQEFLAMSWPILIGIGGIMKLTSGSCKCC